MRYWDASALVPLLISEPGSRCAEAWFTEDGHVVTWAWTRTEITSAIERCARKGTLNRRQRRAVLDRLESLAAEWDEVTDVLSVRARANSVLARHPLRAADAGQLGAALLVNEHLPDPLVFLCLDRRLCDAAEREGLRVMDAGGP